MRGPAPKLKQKAIGIGHKVQGKGTGTQQILPKSKTRKRTRQGRKTKGNRPERQRAQPDRQTAGLRSPAASRRPEARSEKAAAPKERLAS